MSANESHLPDGYLQGPPPKRAESVSTYLAGPMAGIPEHNYPLFRRVSAYYRQTYNREIIDPTDWVGGSPPEDKSYNECLKGSLRELLRADSIFLLPGWERSRGATLELLVAVLLGYRVYLVIVWPGPSATEPEQYSHRGYACTPLTAILRFITTWGIFDVQT
jgi:hypothetical protein